MLVSEYAGMDFSEQIDAVKNYHAFLARKFEFNLNKSLVNGAEGTANSTAYVHLAGSEPVKELDTIGGDLRLSVDLDLISPTPNGKDAVSGVMAIVRLFELEGDKYGIGLEWFKDR